MQAANNRLHLYVLQQDMGRLNNEKYNPRAYFFDNPRRYDSDDDLSISRSLQSRGRLESMYVCFYVCFFIFDFDVLVIFMVIVV